MMFCKLCGMALVASASALLPHSSTVRAVRAGPTAVMMSASSEATQQLRARVRGLLDEVPQKLAGGASMPPSAARLEDAYAADSHDDMYVNFLEFFMDLKIEYDVSEEDETDVLKLAHAIAGIDRDTIRYKQELDTLTENFKLETEALEHVQDRVTSVASELNAVMSGEQTETLTEARELGTRSAWSKNSRMWPLWPRLRRTHPRPKGKCCSVTSQMVPSCPAA